MAKRFHYCITCLVDLSGEILLNFCRYMAPVGVLRAFFTTETPAARLHRVILIYRTHINLSETTFSEHGYIMKLFNESCYSLRHLSLIVNHEQIPFVAIRYLES
ncbi:unnamed protein product [Rotaria sp. Silwood2]|nr:unnamed protein product [Rotaria sp. Silwood2]CAF4083676.1 unnamed protein product [Rotaria sp. Silwood2]